jgi:DNA-binding SARP family transcriptional activator
VVVEDAVETHVETQSQERAEGSSALSIQMMGRMRLLRDGHPVQLPPSRKVRALLAYLALADHPIGRSRLCEVLGDIPSDPRGELRWYLSKLRSVLDSDGSRRVVADSNMVSLDLSDVTVDAIEIEKLVRTRLRTAETGDLRQVLKLFVGDLLEGIDLNRSPQLDHWLTTRRSHFRSCHAAVLAELIERLPVDDPETRQLS